MENQNKSINGKLLVHIAFHYFEHRVQYLRQLLEAIDSYKFSEIKIVIDTNNEDSKNKCEKLFLKYSNISYMVHEKLDHPHMLTWTHREQMKNQIDNYDFFMYTEDDMLVSWPGIYEWYEDTKLIYPYGFLRGFLRVEKRKNYLVATDYLKCMKNPKVLSFKNKKFINPIYPYSAFWIYTHEQMKEFIKSQAWIDGDVDWTIRASAAAGMRFSNVPKGYDNRELLPLSPNYKISEIAYTHHLPNNYGKQKRKIISKKIFTRKIFTRNQWATMPVNKIIKFNKNKPIVEIIEN
jgi:hypothetical protein